ncbi:hypothetical protein, partial [Neobacillus mesonae]|uniref:hypothetical protein n=1 Tax=Neobacillus mesonae TaxID=1193713 RepID=UPI002041D448
YPCDGIVSHNIKILLENRVEKYFFDTPPTGQTVDKSTFIEGGEKIYVFYGQITVKKNLVL